MWAGKLRRAGPGDEAEDLGFRVRIQGSRALDSRASKIFEGSWARTGELIPRP